MSAAIIAAIVAGVLVALLLCAVVAVVIVCVALRKRRWSKCKCSHSTQRYTY